MQLNDEDILQAKTIIELADNFKGEPIGEMLATSVMLLSPAEQSKVAEKFAEGSKEYKQWMLNLWSGIPTLAGCSGIGKNHERPSLVERIKKCNNLSQETYRNEDGNIAISPARGMSIAEKMG